MSFFNVYKHLLPKGNAFSITINKKLRQFFQGISVSADSIKDYLDLIFYDLLPEDTRQLELWEEQWNLRYAENLTITQRRERLSAVWKEAGGQDPKFIQDTLQSYGFDLYAHDWFDPTNLPPIGTDDPVTPRNPTSLLTLDYTSTGSIISAGEPTAEAGEPTAQFGNLLQPPGYLIVNKSTTPVPNVTSLSGISYMESGEAFAQSGNFFSYAEELNNPEIPTDPLTWPWFCYFSAEDFGVRATVPIERRAELEDLLLSLVPAHLWIGLMVQYTAPPADVTENGVQVVDNDNTVIYTGVV